MFQFTGIAAISFGCVCTGVGLIALLIARLRGAPARSVTARLGLLLANYPLAFLYLQGLGVAAIQRVEVINRSDEPVVEILLEASRVPHSVDRLEPGENLVWRFRSRSEGVLNFRAQQGEQSLEGDNLAMFFVFCRKDVFLTVEQDGSLSVEERDGAPWSWLPWR